MPNRRIRRTRSLANPHNETPAEDDGGMSLDALRARLLDTGVLARLEFVPETGSTNDDLAAAASTWPDPGLLVTDHQRGGHGRRGRTWSSAPGTSVLASLLLRPRVEPADLGWLPLLVGLAVARAVRVAGADAVLKWPNDVLVPAHPGSLGVAEDLPGWGRQRKVAGILSRVTPHGVVVGWGINVTQEAADLPVETATSLGLVGARVDRGEVLACTVEEVCALVARWEESGGDAHAAGLAREYAEVSATIGAWVRVELADGSLVTGDATGLADDAALIVWSAGGNQTVHAGDVAHLRR